MGVSRIFYRYLAALRQGVRLTCPAASLPPGKDGAEEARMGSVRAFWCAPCGPWQAVTSPACTPNAELNLPQALPPAMLTCTPPAHALAGVQRAQALSARAHLATAVQGPGSRRRHRAAADAAGPVPQRGTAVHPRSARLPQRAPHGWQVAVRVGGVDRGALIKDGSSCCTAFPRARTAATVQAPGMH